MSETYKVNVAIDDAKLTTVSLGTTQPGSALDFLRGFERLLGRNHFAKAFIHDAGYHDRRQPHVWSSEGGFDISAQCYLSNDPKGQSSQSAIRL